MFGESDIFTVRGAAEKLSVHPDTVRRLIKTGKLGSVRVRSVIRVCGWQLNEYIDAAAKSPQ